MISDMKFIRVLFIHWPVLIIGMLGIWWVMSFDQGMYHWQWRRALRYVIDTRGEDMVLGPLVLGLELTIYIVAMSFVLSLFLGLGAALLRYTPSFVCRALYAGYVGSVRNTPLLIQIFIIYFVFAPVLGMSPFWAGVWSLALFEGAYMAEVFRAGLAFIPRGQWDAAWSLGFSRCDIMRHIILPQALRRMLPPLTNQTISLIKDSALVSAIALADLTMQAQVLIAEVFLPLEIWILVAVLYLLLTLAVTVPSRLLERYYAWRWL